MPATIPERRVQEIWQSAVQQRNDLKTTSDGPVKIIYPGRPNDGRGADIKDAVIQTGQGLFKGDIEIHVKSGAWKEHGHSADPAYNQVVLHVVFEDDKTGKARRQNGLEMPTLPLLSFTEKQAGRRLTTAFTPDFTLPCTTDSEILDREVEKAGEARFFEKAREYEENILREGAGQTLYRGTMTALGYAKNKTPMARLTNIVTSEEIELILSRATSDKEASKEVKTRLLTTAGLMVHQGGEKHSDDWAELELIRQRREWRAEMSRGEWEFFKVRPGNYPTRRIAGMAVLLTRMRKEGLLTGLETIILKAAEDGGMALEKALSVEAEKTDSPVLIGKDRTGDIIVNVVLPFYVAYARIMEKNVVGEAAAKTYRAYRGGEENSLEKHMRQQLKMSPKAAATAIRRQGLIHIYKAFCTQGRCAECPLNQGNSNTIAH